MKQFLTTNFKYILFVVVGLFVMYWMVYLFTPKPQMSELDKYKLEQIDKHIKQLKKMQENLNDSLNVYEKKINEIDFKISHIKVERKEVNNYYTQKKEDIKNADKRQIDSLLRKRYNF